MTVVQRQLRRRSLSEEVADTLREMILMGELRPEQRVKQDELAIALGVSTMPVREALLKLAHEGLVEASPNRSFRVVRHRREDVRDIYWMHATLAGELAARACQNQDRHPELLDRLRGHQEAMLAAIACSDTTQMDSANWQFHREINVGAEAPKLLLVLRGTLRLIPQHFYALVASWTPAARAGHEAILDAFAGRRPGAARRAAVDHVLEAAEQLIAAHFNDTGYWTPPG